MRYASTFLQLQPPMEETAAKAKKANSKPHAIVLDGVGGN